MIFVPTWLPFEISTFESTSCLGVKRLVGIRVQGRAVVTPRTLSGGDAISVVGVWGPWWSIEGVAFHFYHIHRRWSKVGALEDCCGLRTNLLFQRRCSKVSLRILLGLFSGPCWGKRTLVWWQLGETFDVVAVPQEELEVFRGVFNVDKIVHEVTSGAWLRNDTLALLYTELQDG